MTTFYNQGRWCNYIPLTCEKVDMSSDTEHATLENGKCVVKESACGNDTHFQDGKCVSTVELSSACGNDTHFQDGKCVVTIESLCPRGAIVPIDQGLTERTKRIITKMCHGKPYCTVLDKHLCTTKTIIGGIELNEENICGYVKEFGLKTPILLNGRKVCEGLS